MKRAVIGAIAAIVVLAAAVILIAFTEPEGQRGPRGRTVHIRTTQPHNSGGRGTATSPVPQATQPPPSGYVAPRPSHRPNHQQRPAHQPTHKPSHKPHHKPHHPKPPPHPTPKPTCILIVCVKVGP